MRGDDRVDLRQPLVGGSQVLGIVRPGPGRLRRQPAGQTAGVGLGVDVRARPRDHVQTHPLRVVEQFVDIPNAAEVVDARRRRVIVPVEVDADRVEARRLHLRVVFERVHLRNVETFSF